MEVVTQAQAGEAKVAQRGQQEDLAAVAPPLPEGALPAPVVLCTFSLVPPRPQQRGHTARVPLVGLQALFALGKAGNIDPSALPLAVTPLSPHVPDTTPLP